MRCVILEIGEDGVFNFIKCWFIIEKKIINMLNVLMIFLWMLNVLV